MWFQAAYSFLAPSSSNFATNIFTAGNYVAVTPFYTTVPTTTWTQYSATITVPAGTSYVTLIWSSGNSPTLQSSR